MKWFWFAAAILLVVLAAVPAAAKPAYCSCSHCRSVSAGSPCTVRTTGEVVSCDDVLWYQCQDNWRTPAAEQRVDEFLETLTVNEESAESEAAPLFATFD